jgi:hypothetical protein
MARRCTMIPIVTRHEHKIIMITKDFLKLSEHTTRAGETIVWKQTPTVLTGLKLAIYYI